MPSKGDSRATNASPTATIAPVAGPAVAAAQASTRALLDDLGSIQAVVGEPIAAGISNVATRSDAVPSDARVPDLEEPDVETPEWAEFYARAVERNRNERERIDREQAEAQRLW